MFIIDFDDTLFDTHAFKQARLEVLKTIGVSADLFWETYKQARNDGEGNFTYSDRRHAQFLALANFDENQVFEKLSEISSRLQDFLFSDARNFLEAIKKYGQSMVLLSLGDPSFQEFKLKGSGIHSYFNHVFMVSASKEKILEEIFKFEKVDKAWFINDKVDETRILAEKFSVLSPVLKISQSIDQDDYLNSGIPFFKTLKEIQEYVRQAV